MSEAPAKRRWFRFSLRMMFVVVTLCAAASPFLKDDVEADAR